MLIGFISLWFFGKAFLATYYCQFIHANSNVSSCDIHLENVTIYMDSFEWLNKKCFIGHYGTFITATEICPPFPGGGTCNVNTDYVCSDAMMSYAIHSDLGFQRQYANQILIAFTMEAEKGHYVRFPQNYKHDIKISYHRDSDIPYPFICEQDRALQLIKRGQPTVPQDRSKIIGIISNCHSSLRTKYVTELMKYIEIDQFGRCFQTHRENLFSTRKSSNWEEKKLEFLLNSNYKYILAFENTIEPDYVTEKVYHGLLTYTIPIYYGDSAVFDLIPGDHTIIYAPDFTPKKLAEYIQKIDNNQTLYSSFFRNWNLEKIKTIHEKYCKEHFMCKVCRKSLEIKYQNTGCTNAELMKKLRQ